MYLLNKIKAVNKVYEQLEKHNSNFRIKSCLSCIPDCGECCLTNHIEATVLEFLPAAYNLYLSGKYESILEAIENKIDEICVFYNPFSREGFCSDFQNRGMVCRLFGFAAKTNKKNEKVLAACKHIKSLIQPEKLKSSVLYAPEMSSYYMKLYCIDPWLATLHLPINGSIKKAIEIVAMHFQYKKKKMA